MNPYVWSIIALAVGALAGYLIGLRRASDADDYMINGLREALVRTQKALTEANAVKAEAVAAQEQAEEQLKAAFERRSEAGKRAWQTRKAHAA